MPKTINWRSECFKLRSNNIDLEAINAELLEAMREVVTLFNDKGQWIGGPDATQNEMLPRWQALLTKATGD